ncbi:MAG: hypothetical protein LBI11_07170 [Streptococcaceae bacterium]|jgi:hypothetical protein|nr:hypothetical protein [Streptococcaceae bacterium]
MRLAINTSTAIFSFISSIVISFLALFVIITQEIADSVMGEIVLLVLAIGITGLVLALIARSRSHKRKLKTRGQILAIIGFSLIIIPAAYIFLFIPIFVLLLLAGIFMLKDNVVKPQETLVKTPFFNESPELQMQQAQEKTPEVHAGALTHKLPPAHTLPEPPKMNLPIELHYVPRNIIVIIFSIIVLFAFTSVGIFAIGSGDLFSGSFVTLLFGGFLIYGIFYRVRVGNHVVLQIEERGISYNDWLQKREVGPIKWQDVTAFQIYVAHGSKGAPDVHYVQILVKDTGDYLGEKFENLQKQPTWLRSIRRGFYLSPTEFPNCVVMIGESDKMKLSTSTGRILKAEEVMAILYDQWQKQRRIRPPEMPPQKMLAVSENSAQAVSADDGEAHWENGF